MDNRYRLFVSLLGVMVILDVVSRRGDEACGGRG